MVSVFEEFDALFGRLQVWRGRRPPPNKWKSCDERSNLEKHHWDTKTATTESPDTQIGFRPDRPALFLSLFTDVSTQPFSGVRACVCVDYYNSYEHSRPPSASGLSLDHLTTIHPHAEHSKNIGSKQRRLFVISVGVLRLMTSSLLMSLPAHTSDTPN